MLVDVQCVRGAFLGSFGANLPKPGLRCMWQRAVSDGHEMRCRLTCLFELNYCFGIRPRNIEVLFDPKGELLCAGN
jgi:hypothetical protein